MYMRRDTNVSEKEVYKREITRMNKVIRRIVMTAIVVGLMSGMCLVAEAATTDGINYKDATGNTESCTDYTVVSNDTSWNEGWYAVTEDTSISDTIIIRGNVNLILCDGAKLSVYRDGWAPAISLADGSTLSIYEGSTSDSIIGSGALSATSTGNEAIRCYGTINIYGGRITADSYAGAGIYGAIGRVNIYGGLVKAAGASSGIEGPIRIEGGTVIANGNGPSGYGHGLNSENNISVGSDLLKYESDDGSSWSTIDTLGTKTLKYAVIGEGIAQVTQVNSNSKYPTLDIALQNCEPGDIITLLRDVYTFDTTTIPADKSITLDLNDHGIMFAGGGNASVFRIESGGVFKLEDASANKTDRYITLSNGRGTGIRSNEAAGAIAVTGGFITGGTGTAEDGHIYGGGVNNAGRFFMLGGTIAGNTADYGGGVYTTVTSDFQIENAPEIRDNAVSNVYLPENKTITVAGPLGNENPIGVTMQTPGQFTVNGDYAVNVSDYKDLFVSDDSDYIVSILNDPSGDQLQLLMKNPPKPPEPPAPKPAAKISGTPLTTMTAKDKTGMTIAWQKVTGAEGYDIFFSRCDGKGKTTAKKAQTINGNSTFAWTRSGLTAGVSYKAYVKAYVMKNGSKQYVAASPLMHAYTKGYTKRYTNAKSVKVKKTKVSIKKGKTFKIKAKVKKLKKGKKLMPTKHELKLRYLSTDTSIATVSKKGKIKGVKAGTCYVYAYAHNGVFKKITVTVK